MVNFTDKQVKCFQLLIYPDIHQELIASFSAEYLSEEEKDWEIKKKD